jgi:hypothetical protein
LNILFLSLNLFEIVMQFVVKLPSHLGNSVV